MEAWQKQTVVPCPLHKRVSGVTILEQTKKLNDPGISEERLMTEMFKNT